MSIPFPMQQQNFLTGTDDSRAACLRCRAALSSGLCAVRRGTRRDNAAQEDRRDAMMPIYFMGLSFAIFAVGICGMAASRHFLVMMISSEVAIIASTLLVDRVLLFQHRRQHIGAAPVPLVCRIDGGHSSRGRVQVSCEDGGEP